MARTVLAEPADASTPTQDLILARTAARLDAEHGTGAVPLPGRTRARALLREITRGTSAFGGAKARREIAGRPAAPSPPDTSHAAFSASLSTAVYG
jgi:hypothetical protein